MPSDLKQVLPLWRELIGSQNSSNPYVTSLLSNEAHYLNYLTRQLTASKSFIFIAEKGMDRVAAYIHAEIINHGYIQQESGFIHELVVLPSCRNHGLGKKLFEHALQWFQKNKITTIELDIAANNPDAALFWRTLGFIQLGPSLIKEIRI